MVTVQILQDGEKTLEVGLFQLTLKIANFILLKPKAHVSKHTGKCTEDISNILLQFREWKYTLVKMIGRSAKPWPQLWE